MQTIVELGSISGKLSCKDKSREPSTKQMTILTTNNEGGKRYLPFCSEGLPAHLQLFLSPALPSPYLQPGSQKGQSKAAVTITGSYGTIKVTENFQYFIRNIALCLEKPLFPWK